MNTMKDTLDTYSNGITVEGAMKHPLYRHKTIQDESIKIGEDMGKVFLQIKF